MSLTESLKSSFHRAAPALYGSLQEAWTSYRTNKVTEAVVSRHGLVVQGGPFAGMQYVKQSAGSSLLPKLLGCYEAELHETISAIIKSEYKTIIDIGCAEGYYAVGLAVRVPGVRVLAFDTDPRARELCLEMAKVNGVTGRVLVEGECNHERLSALIDDRTLIICDCEGCELHLLDPTVVPGLTSCDLLVELHDFIDRSISPTLVSRFAETHDVSMIDTQERDPTLYDALRSFSDWDQRVAVAEFREEEMQWAFMRSGRSKP